MPAHHASPTEMMYNVDISDGDVDRIDIGDVSCN